MEPITGVVERVRVDLLPSNRAGTQLTFYLDKVDPPYPFILLPSNYGSLITCDERQGVMLPDLLAWLATHRQYSVTLHPLTERYGASLQAEFVSL